MAYVIVRQFGEITLGLTYSLIGPAPHPPMCPAASAMAPSVCVIIDAAVKLP